MYDQHGKPVYDLHEEAMIAPSQGGLIVIDHDKKSPATLALYDEQVDQAIRQLANDIRQRPAKGWTADDDAKWATFFMQWEIFHQQLDSWWYRYYNLDEAWAEVRSYELELAGWHERYKEAGGKSTFDKPKLGYDKPPGAVGPGAYLGVAALFGVGYLLSQIRGVVK